MQGGIRRLHERASVGAGGRAPPRRHQEDAEYALALAQDEYTYDRKLEGEDYPYRLRPDFSWGTDAGELIIWGRLGMLDRDDYQKSWDKKKAWYASNGYIEGVNLFTSTEGPGRDMNLVADVADRVRKALDR